MPLLVPRSGAPPQPHPQHPPDPRHGGGTHPASSPLHRSPHAEAELASAWDARSTVIDGYVADARSLRASQEDASRFASVRGAAAAGYPEGNRHLSGGPSAAAGRSVAAQAELELAALQEAFRRRRAAEGHLARRMHATELTTPSRRAPPPAVPHDAGSDEDLLAALATPPPPQKETAAAATTAANKADGPAFPLRDSTPSPPRDAAAAKPAEAKRKPRPKPAWDAVFAAGKGGGGEAAAAAGGGGGGGEAASAPKTEKEEDEYFKSLYTRGSVFQKKKEREMEKKAHEALREDAPHTPYITPYAAELRESNPRNDKALGEYYYKRGKEHLSKCDRNLKKKRQEIHGEDGVRARPEISESAQQLRPPNKTADAIGKYMYDTGRKFRTKQEAARKRKDAELKAEEDMPFQPKLSAKTAALASQAEARQAGLFGTGYQKTNRLGKTPEPSAPEARLYDRGLMFNFAREQALEKKKKEQEAARREGVTHTPRINDRSRRLAARAARRSPSRGRATEHGVPAPLTPPEYAYPALAFEVTPPPPPLRASLLDGVADAGEAFATALLSAAAGPATAASSSSASTQPLPTEQLYRSRQRQRVATPSGEGSGSPDLLAPPDIDNVLSEVRIQQEMRRLGIS